MAFLCVKGGLIPGLASAALLWLLHGGATAWGKETDWEIKGANGFQSKSTALGALFQISVNGRSFVAVAAGKDAEGTAEPTDKQNQKQMEAVFDGQPVAVKRQMQLDESRNAVRILDVFTNTAPEESRVRVDYTTQVNRSGQMKFNGVISDAGEMREYGNGVPDGSVGVIVMAETQTSPAVPLFLWGQPDAAWPVSLSDVGSSVRLSYEGTIPRGGKVALLHWVATAGLDPKVKLERTFDLFWKNGRLVEPMVAEADRVLVRNFKAEAFSKEGGAVENALVGGSLPLLDAWCERLKVARGTADILIFGGEERLSGEFLADKIRLKSWKDGSDRGTYEPDKVAAIAGGGGVGRAQRLYLRDGSVWEGRVELENGRFRGGVGEMKLKAEALSFLVLRRAESDGKAPAGVQGSVRTLGGGFMWVKAWRTEALHLMTALGPMQVPLEQILGAERRSEAPFHQVVLLKDGSRMHGAIATRDLAFMMEEYDGAGREMILPLAEVTQWQRLGKAAGEAADVAAFCVLADGSRLAGRFESEKLMMATSNGLLPVNTAEIRSLEVTDSLPEAGTMRVEMADGTKMTARLADEMLSWSMEGRQVWIPSALIMSMKRPQADNPEQNQEGRAP